MVGIGGMPQAEQSGDYRNEQPAGSELRKPGVKCFEACHVVA
jgi:hypothetical protein